MIVKHFVNNPFQENTYVVYDESTCDAAIIDCGALFDNEKSAIENFIREKELNVKHILNTHLHLDHCFGNFWAANLYGIKPFAHADDQPLLDRLQDQVAMFGFSYKVTAQPLGGYIKDGDIISFGDISLRVLHTPGHTRGGVCFYDEYHSILFSGDTLFCGSIGRTDLAEGSMISIVNSIKTKLIVLPDDTKVFCGHGPQTTIGFEKNNNPYF